ncbi:MAG: 4Fe-4S binding protein [Verrucomicrobiota bacterium]
MSSEDSSRKTKPSSRLRTLARIAVPVWRIGLLVAVFFCIHHVHSGRTEKAERQLEAGWIEELVPWIPAARSFGEPAAGDLLSPVLNAEDELVGWAAQTFPEAREVTGYAGASRLLVAFDPDRRVLGTVLLESEDTVGHVAMIEKDDRFFTQWSGRHAASLNALDEPYVVSGATLTSEAMARGLSARFGAVDAAEWFPDPLELKQVRLLFPDADGFEVVEGGVYGVGGGEKERIILRSSRMGVAVRGFQGASDLLVGLEGGRIVGVRMIGSRDNEPYTLDLADELEFADPYADRGVDDWPEEGRLLVVSGASYTARSVEESVREMLRRHLRPEAEAAIDWRLIAGLLWIASALVIALSKLKSNRRLRYGFALVSMLGGGLWLGWMVAQDQWITWAKRGSLSGTGLAMLALSAAAILVPGVFGKNVYCSHICPHGAAQTLVGALRKRRFALPPKFHHLLTIVPWLSLIALWLLAMAGSRFSASYAEPFEIWSAGFFALMPAVIFGVGLVGAAFLPQAYCHYGCPTGALLKFLTHSPSRWSRRDSIALGLLAAAWAFALMS